MTYKKMLRIIQAQLAKEMNCTTDDLNGEMGSFIFTEARDNPGRRPFFRNEHHFAMLTMGNAIIVSASPNILEIVKPLLIGRTRDEAFSMPFIYSHAINYLPDLTQIKQLPAPDGFVYNVVEQKDISSLYQYPGFNNAISYDATRLRPDVLVVSAIKDSQIVGMAGSSDDCEMMWQVGMDVLPEYRNYGLGAYLVNRLTLEIIDRGYIPFYCTSPTNIASQRVAHRAGYFPSWMCSYKGKFDEFETMPIC
jgi:GNAT superfamily N-acetyltransferase